jgi:hypothetical protein
VDNWSCAYECVLDNHERPSALPNMQRDRNQSCRHLSQLSKMQRGNLHSAKGYEMILFHVDARTARGDSLRDLFALVMEHPGEEEVQVHIMTSQGAERLRLRPTMRRFEGLWDEARAMGNFAIPVDSDQISR